MVTLTSDDQQRLQAAQGVDKAQSKTVGQYTCPITLSMPAGSPVVDEAQSKAVGHTVLLQPLSVLLP